MYGVSDKHKEELNQWYKDIKKQLTAKAHENFFKRLQDIIHIVNIKLDPHHTKLRIDDAERSKMWTGIANDIDSWKGVEITACTKQKTNYKSYAITSRNWWNRNKAKVYGNHFFYPIIFVYIKQSIDGLNLPQQEKQYHFVDIFDQILRAKIQFPQTRAQPIIPHQSFIQPNKFKYSSIDLLKRHDIHWNGKNIESAHKTVTATSGPRSYYVKDKDRSLKVNTSFMDSLELLKQQLYHKFILKHGNAQPLQIKSEANDGMLCVLKKENTNRNQCLPPSVKSSLFGGVHCTNLAVNNGNPLVLSHGTSMEMTRGNVANLNGINLANNVNTSLTFAPPIMNHNATAFDSLSMNDALFNGVIMNPMYAVSRGQTNTVSQQRYSPSSVALPLPMNRQNVNNSYYSIRTDPLSGQLMLSFHIPLS
eukprot:109177_1